MQAKSISIRKQISLNNQDIVYTSKISSRAKHLRLAIYCNGEFVITRPRRISELFVEKFIREKADWILKRINSAQNNVNPLNLLTRRDYLNNRAQARTLIQERLEYFNKIYKYKYGRINIRNQKTRWGSCSLRGDLNFNFRLLYLPEKVRDYVIVHELCHLKEFNHSSRFWRLVAETMPEFRDLRKKLKNGQLI